MESAAIVVPLFLLTIGVGVVWLGRKVRILRRRAKRMNAPLPPLIVPTSAGASDIVPAGVSRATGSRLNNQAAGHESVARPFSESDGAEREEAAFRSMAG